MRDAVGVVPGDPLRDLPRARPPRPGGPPPHRQHPEKVWDMQIRRIYRNIIHTYLYISYITEFYNLLHILLIFVCRRLS